MQRENKRAGDTWAIVWLGSLVVINTPTDKCAFICVRLVEAQYIRTFSFRSSGTPWDSFRGAESSIHSKYLWAFPVNAGTISQSVLTGERGIISHMSTEICYTSLTIIFVSRKKSPLDSDRASSSSLRLIFCVLSFRVTEGKEAVEIVVGMTLLRFWSKWARGNDQGLTVSPCCRIS